MHNYSVIFLSTANEQGMLIPADSTLAVATLHYWLSKEGIGGIAMFPESPDVDMNNIHKRFEEYIDGNNADIYAISCWSSGYTTALMYTEMIKEKRPEAVIVGGGVHFHSRENISKALYHGRFDIIFQGGAEPFFEFCKNLFINRILTISKNPVITLKGKVPENGLFYLENGKLKAGRRGILTKAVVPVTRIADSYAEITALFSDECDNHCDYCSVFKNRSNADARTETEQLVTDPYHRLSEVWNGPVLLSIMDSSPFLDKNRCSTFESIKRLAALDRRIHFSVLAAPEDLNNELAAFSKENRLTIFFIGRDRINEDHFTGRRLKGRLRTQEQLDEERRTLADFIRAMQGTYCDIFIGYIASPFDTAQSAAMLIEEIKYYSGMAQTVRVIPDIFILNPYGGTSVHRKAGKNAWDISEFSYPYPNVWNGKDTAMIWLELLRLTVAPVFSAGGAKMGLFLLEFASHYAFGNPLPSSEGFTEELKMLAGHFTENIRRMRLGNETSLQQWQKHMKELRHWGLMTGISAREPGMVAEYGTEWLTSYIRDNDTLAGLFDRDLALIASKERKGTWYERWAEE